MKRQPDLNGHIFTSPKWLS